MTRQIIEWTPENVATLRALWDEGLSTRLIGLRMNITKNAVIGKANRLHLSARPSPVKRGEPKVKTRVALPEGSAISLPSKAQLMGRR